MARIGDILRRSVSLSAHDVEEILQEQKASRKPFGEAALALGLVSSDAVWNAWLEQLRTTTIDLARQPIDPMAVGLLPQDLARTYGVVPLRLRGNVLVIAAAEVPNEATLRQIEMRCRVRLVLAIATASSVTAALADLYPTAVSAA